MAWANLANIIVTSLAYVPFRPKNAPWLPSLSGWKTVFNFGSGAILGNCLSSVNTAIPDMVLGRLNGTHDVGITSRAIATANLFTQIAGPTVNYAILPLLSRKHHAGESLQEPMGKAISYLTGFAWPVVALTGIFSESVISVLYGPKWMECKTFVADHCLTILIGMPFTFITTALMAIGKPYLSAIPGAVALIFKATSILVLYDGSVMSFVVALLASTLLQVPMLIWIQKLTTLISLFEGS